MSLLLLIALSVHLLLIAACAMRVVRGRNAIDRLIAVDLVGVLLLSCLVLLALASGVELFIDIAVGVCLLGFIVTLVLARFIADNAASELRASDSPSTPGGRP